MLYKKPENLAMGLSANKFFNLRVELVEKGQRSLKMLPEEFEESDSNYQDGSSRGPCAGCL